MAFMPAEEEDDFGSDDGLIDSEIYREDVKDFSSQRSISAEILPVQNQVHNSAEERSAQWTKYHRTAVLSMDDFKMAVIKGNTELVEQSLRQGLDVETPLQCGWTVFMYAANYGRSDLVQLLLSRGANPNCHCDMFTALMCACSASSHSEEEITKCVQILAEWGADVNAKDRFHTTALMLASKDGHVCAVKELIKHGAAVNEQDSRGWTALTWATMRAARAVMVELLKSGADANMLHADRLTVKDLAAHLPTDEMLAILENRPVSVACGAGDVTGGSVKSSTSEASIFMKENGVRATDLRYGELEVFLLGLDLSHLVSLFQRQLIDLSLLMTLTEQDLINAGVDQIGARKKLLDAVQALHKKDWQPSSLVSIHFNKQIRCSDAVAIVANCSKHLRYIGSTVVYVREQFRRHPHQVTQPTDEVNVKQLLRHSEDAVKNVLALQSELERLQSELVTAMKKQHIDPADLVEADSRKVIKKPYRLGCVFYALIFGLSTSGILWYNRASLQKLVNSIYSRFLIV
ncbi:hypothetical protein BsWGS_13981 [Bradybaena similaris]